MVANQRDNEPGLSVAISIDGELAYHGWAGQANLEHHVPIDADTRFAIASISKQFTAFAIMALVEEGTLSLDQPVHEIIPELEVRPVPVTIRHLLNHTSGLREANSLLLLSGQSDLSPVKQAQSLDLIYRQRGGNFSAGVRQEYSNTGYQLLAEIIERLTGQPYPQFLQDRIFEPLGMSQTFVRTEPGQVIENLAAGYRPQRGGFTSHPVLSATYGSTGIVSTPRDLLVWGDALNSGTIGGAEVIKAMETRSSLASGRRLIATNGQEYRRFRGVDTWSHGGSTGGFRSFLLRVPAERISIAVMGNRSDFLKAAFAFKVASVVLSDRLETEQVAAFVPERGAALDRYVGDYRLFAGVVFSLRRQGDELTFASFGGEQATPLRQIARGVFELDPSAELRLEFCDLAEGRATEMRWQISDDGFIPAPRVTMQPIPQTPLDTSELTGAYFSETLQQVVSVYDLQGEIWLRTGDARSVALERYQPDIFRPRSASRVQKLEFVRNENGHVTHALLSTSLADNIEYRRIDAE
ncbi:MAG: serine hydrolase domain-containing protein [Pseudomonadota bacterium]